MTVTCVPGSITVASLDAPRQSSPSTLTLPGTPGPMRSVTMPVFPSSASTPVRSSEPEPCCEHLPDEQADRQQKPKQPILHMVKAATLVRVSLSNWCQLLVEPL